MLGPHYIFAVYSNTYWAPNDYIHFLLIFYCKPLVCSCKWWILLLTYWLIDWSWCDGYLWWSSYIHTYWTSNDSHINHDQRLFHPYILTHNWKLFFLNVWCSVCVIGCQHISSYILSTKGYIHIMTAMQNFGGCRLFILICTLSVGFSRKKDWWWWWWWRQMTHISTMKKCLGLTI